MVPSGVLRWLAVAAIATGACATEDSTAGDPFPIHVDRVGGALVAQVSIDGEAPVTAVIDVMSPLTVVRRRPPATSFTRTSPDSVERMARPPSDRTSISPLSTCTSTSPRN